MDGIREEAERVKASGVLGRSSNLVALFDYLVDRSVDGQAIKETEIAYQVYGKPAGYDVGNDALVRVHVHRLRTKLAQYYAATPPGEHGALTIPKGEYRIRLAPLPAAPAAAASPPENPAARSRGISAGLPWRATAIVAMVLLGLALGWIVLSPSRTAPSPLQQSALWRPYALSSRTTVIVLGDEFAYGERDAAGNVTGYHRNPKVNSPEEWAEYRMLNPQAARQMDGSHMQYLPTGVAGAVLAIQPVLFNRPVQGGRLRILNASQLLPDMLRGTNIVYVGYIGDLGMLGIPLSASTRIAGDWQANRLSAGTGPNGAPRDLGYIATFSATGDNRITIVAGTSDAGLLQAAETITSTEALKHLENRANGARDYEALITVSSIGQLNMAARVRKVLPLDTAAMWRAGL